MIADLGILEPDPQTRELTLVAVHDGVTVEQVREATGWDLRVSADVRTTPPPTVQELRVLRELKERTAKAHSSERSEHTREAQSAGS